MASNRPVPDTARELPNPLQGLPDCRHDIAAVDKHRRGGAITERDVQRSAIFGVVDVFAGEHPGDTGLEALLASEVH